MWRMQCEVRAVQNPADFVGGHVASGGVSDGSEAAVVCVVVWCIVMGEISHVLMRRRDGAVEVIWQLRTDVPSAGSVVAVVSRHGVFCLSKTLRLGHRVRFPSGGLSLQTDRLKVSLLRNERQAREEERKEESR